MSEPATEVTPPGPSAGGGNVLTRKVGPLPTWAWLAIIGVGGATVWLIAKHRQNAAAAADAGTAAGGSSGGCQDASGNDVPCDQLDSAGQIATLQTELQDLAQEVSQLDKTGTVPPDQPPPARLPTFFREIATGQQSLNAVAKARHTTVAHLEEVTRASAGKPGGISAKNLAAFNAYVSKGTGHRMPRGLVYFTSSPGGVSAPLPPEQVTGLQPGGPIVRS
jgi:hypothetical protein